MRLYLAGLASVKGIITTEKPLYALQSFVNNKKDILYTLSLVGKENFLLDSGAFTFMNNKKKNKEMNIDNIYKFLNDYINFINEYDIKYFFNLDLDTIIGVDKTKELRDLLEKKTNKKCIPVFHKCMGLDTYKKLIKQYNYIAIGTIQDFRKYPKVIKKMNYIAKKNNCKVHGLGYTPLDVLSSGFYSVDSTSWLSGGRYGDLLIFKENNIIKYHPKNKKAKDYKKINKFNLNEYIKYQKYLKEK